MHGTLVVQDGPRSCRAVPIILLKGDSSLMPQVVCTLGPKSRSVPILEELLRAGMSVARFNFSHGSHDYHQVRN